jgi:glycosyltransferase involved in cell wall biosynthesis
MNRPKQLLILSPVAERGGAERVMVDILHYLDRHRYEPHVVFFEEGSLVRQLSDQGYHTDVIRASRLRNPLSYLKVVSYLRRLIRDEKIDAVVSWMPKAHLYGGVAALLEHKPAVWWQHAIPDKHWLHRAASIIPARGVICPSKTSVAAQEKLVTRKPVLLNHLGVDLNEFKPDQEHGSAFRKQYDISENAVIFTYIGRLQRWKRPDVVIRAFNQVNRGTDAYLLILGGALFGLEQDYEDELKRLSNENMDPSRIIFLGHQQNVVPALAASDVVVHASYMEPFGLVIVEAMSMGNIVIAVNRGGPCDIITDGFDGLLYDGSEEQLVGVMQRVLNNELSFSHVGDAARNTVKEKFTVQNMAGIFEQNLECLLSG